MTPKDAEALAVLERQVDALAKRKSRSVTGRGWLQEELTAARKAHAHITARLRAAEGLAEVVVIAIAQFNSDCPRKRKLVAALAEWEKSNEG